MRIYVEAPTYTGKIVVFSYIFTRVYIFFGKNKRPAVRNSLNGFSGSGRIADLLRKKRIEAVPSSSTVIRTRVCIVVL